MSKLTAQSISVVGMVTGTPNPRSAGGRLSSDPTFPTLPYVFGVCPIFPTFPSEFLLFPTFLFCIVTRHFQSAVNCCESVYIVVLCECQQLWKILSHFTCLVLC